MLFYCEKYLKLTSFTSLILSENKELIVKSKKVKYFIYGNSISIKYFSKDEIINRINNNYEGLTEKEVSWSIFKKIFESNIVELFINM